MGTAASVAKQEAHDVASEVACTIATREANKVHADVDRKLVDLEGLMTRRLDAIDGTLRTMGDNQATMQATMEQLKDDRIGTAVNEERLNSAIQQLEFVREEVAQMDKRQDQMEVTHAREMAEVRADNRSLRESQEQMRQELNDLKQGHTKQRVKDGSIILLVVSMLIPVIMYAIQAFSGTDQPPPNVPNVNQPTQTAPQQPGAPADSAP